MKSRKSVRIENPITHGVDFVTRNRARRLVRRGRAVFTDPTETSIRFIEAAHVRQSIEETAAERFTRVMTGRNYDRIQKVIHHPIAEDGHTTRVVSLTQSHHPQRSLSYGRETWNEELKQWEPPRLEASAL